MAHPKRRQGKTRTAKRRTHDKVHGTSITRFAANAAITEVS